MRPPLDLRRELFFAFCLLALTLFSLLRLPWLIGYDVFAGDQVFYLLPVLRSVHPGLFPRDLLTSPNYIQASLSFFTQSVTYCVHLFRGHVTAVLLLLTIGVRFVYFASVYLIVRFLSKNNWLALLAVLLLVNVQPSLVPLATTSDPMLLPRVIAIALGIAAIYFLLRQKWLLSAFTLGTAFIIHPISALAFLIAHYAVLLHGLVKGTARRRSAYAALLVPLVFLAWYVSQVSLGTGLFSVLSSQTWSLLDLHGDIFELFRHPFHNYLGTYYLILDLFLFAIVLYETRRGVLRPSSLNFFWCLGAMVLPLFLSLLQFLFSDLIHFTVVTQLQLSRSLLVWGLMLPILLLLLIRAIDGRTRAGFWMSVSLAGLLFNYLFQVDSYYHLLSETFFALLLAFSFVWYRQWIPLRYTAVMGRILLVLSLVAGTGLLYEALRGHHIGAAAFLICSILAGFGVGLLRSRSFIKRSVRLFPFGAVSLAMMLIVSAVLCSYVLTTRSYEPSYSREPAFAELCTWLHKNVPEDGLALTDPFSQVTLAGEVRMSCGTELLVAQNDGNAAVFNSAFLSEWLSKRDFVSSNLQGTEDIAAGARALAVHYGVQYLIAQKPLMGLPLLFSNQKYYVYSTSI